MARLDTGRLNLVIALALLFAVALWGHAASRPLPRFNLPAESCGGITNPLTWGPDNATIFFVVNGRTKSWNTVSGEVRDVCSGMDATCSPTAWRLAYGNRVRNLDGGAETMLGGETIVPREAWTSDGTCIVARTRDSVTVLNPETHALNRVWRTASVAHAAVSPDLRFLALARMRDQTWYPEVMGAGEPQAYAAALSDLIPNDPKRNGRPYKVVGGVSRETPGPWLSWRPNSEQFVTAIHAYYDLGNDDPSKGLGRVVPYVVIFDRDMQNAHLLGRGDCPMWSSRGEIAYQSRQTVIITDGKGRELAREPFGRNVHALTWSPDGSSLAFLTNEGSQSRDLRQQVTVLRVH